MLIGMLNPEHCGLECSASKDTAYIAQGSQKTETGKPEKMEGKKVQGLKKHKLGKPNTKGQKSVHISGVSKNINKEIQKKWRKNCRNWESQKNKKWRCGVSIPVPLAC